MLAVIIQVVLLSTLVKQTFGAACLKVDEVNQCHFYRDTCYDIQNATFNCSGEQRYHCARNPTTNKFIEVCAVPKQCPIGTEPIIEYYPVAKSSKAVAQISCKKCQDKSRYNNQNETWSYEISECPMQKSDCSPLEHKVLCGYENKDDVYTMNTRCRCDVRNGYIMDKRYDPTKNACTYERGFGCMRANCSSGEDVLLKGYVCEEKCPLGESRSSEKTDECSPNSTPAPPTTPAIVAPPVQENTTNEAPSVSQPATPPSKQSTPTTTPKQTTSTQKSTTTAGSSSKSMSKGVIVGLVVAAVVLIIVAGIVTATCCRHKILRWCSNICRKCRTPSPYVQVNKLSSTDMKQLEEWISEGPRNFELLYSITTDGCDAATFHRRCDNKGPTVTVLYNKHGTVYGGYTGVSWACCKAYTTDSAAFLFRLYHNSQPLPIKFPRKGSSTQDIYDDGNYGPTFGGGHDLQTFSGTINKTGTTFPLNGYVKIGYNYTMENVQKSDFNNDTMVVTELKVYKVTDFHYGEIGKSIHYNQKDVKVDSFAGVKKDGENENVQIDSSDGDTDEEKEDLPFLHKSHVNPHQPSPSHQGSTSSISSNRRSIHDSLPNMSSEEDSKNEVDGQSEPLIVSDSVQRTSSSRSAAKLSRRESRSKVDLSTKETFTDPEERQRSSSLSVFPLYRHEGLDIDTKKKMIEHVIDKNTPFLVDNMVPEPLNDHFHSQGLFLYSTIRDGTETLFTSDKNRFILRNIRRSGWDKYFKFKECLIKTDQKECVRKLQEEEKNFLKVCNGGAGEAGGEDGDEKIEDHSGLIEDDQSGDGNENSMTDTRSHGSCGSGQTADLQTEDTKENLDDDLKEQRAANLLEQLKNSSDIIVEAERVYVFLPVLSYVGSAPATRAISVKGCPDGFQAHHSSGTENSCLYHSISILLAGHERLYKRLRLMATLYACKNFKQIIAEIEKKLKNKDLDYARHIFSNMLNVDHTTHMKSKAELIEDCVMRIIIETVTLGVDSCQMHVFFLSRALGRSIKSHHQTPQYAEQYEELDKVLDTSVEGDSEPLNIMWVHSGNNTDKEPNHVVPLVKRKNHSSDDDSSEDNGSEDDEREGVKKRLLKDGSDRNSPQYSDSPHGSRDSCSSHSHASKDNDNVSGTGNTNEKDTQRESDKVSESTLRNESIDDDNGKENREHVWQSLLTPLK